MLDPTQLANRRSVVTLAHGHADVLVQTLPLGVFAPGDGRGAPRTAVAIGDMMLELEASLAGERLRGEAAGCHTLPPAAASAYRRPHGSLRQHPARALKAGALGFSPAPSAR